MKVIFPFFIFFVGLFVLFFLPQFDFVAFVCFFLAIVIQIEMIWPEKWGDEIQ